MAIKSQLLQKSGIVNLLARKKSISQSSSYKTPELTETKPTPIISQADIDAQKKYEQDLKQYQEQLSTYQEAVAEAKEWELAQKFVLTGKRYDPKSSVGRKIDYIYEHGGKVAILGSASIKQPTAPTTGGGINVVNTPAGYYNENILDAYTKYQNQLTPQQRQMSQYDQNNIITSNPSYQAEINKIKSTPEVQTSMVTFATNQGYTNPTQYGKPYSQIKTIQPTSYLTPSPSATQSVISMPQTEKERFQQLKREKGTFNALSSYLPDLAERKTRDYQIKRANKNPNYQLNHPQESSRLAGLGASIGVFSIPIAGAGLFFASGVETLATGRAKKEKERLTEEGASNFWASTQAYGIPTAEIFLGGYGLKSDANILRQSLFKPAEQTSFIATIERGEKGISNVNVLSQTGKSTALTSEKVMNIPETDIFFSAGKGFEQNIIKKATGDISRLSEFQVLGTGKTLGSSKLVKDFKIIKSSEEIGTGVLSRGYQRNTGRAIESRSIWNPFFGKLGNVERRIKGIKTKPSKFERQDVLGSINPYEGEEGFFSFIGSTNPKLRVYKKGGLSYIIKSPNIKGNIFVVSPEVEEGFTIIKAGSSAKRTPLSKTFQLTNPEVKSIFSQIQTPKVTQEIIKPTKLNILGGENVLQVKEETPSMVGGNGLSYLPYSGTGQYETSETTGFINLGKTKVNQLDFLGERNKFIQPTKPTQDIFQSEEQRIIPTTKEIQSEVIRENQRQNFIQALSLKQEQEQKQEQKLIQQQYFKQPSRSKPKVPVTFWFSQFKKKQGKIPSEDVFSVFGKRFGKDIKLFTGTKEKARGELVSFLKGSLGRSGYISKNGERLSFENLGLSNEFRPSKKEKTRVVQKAEFSLSSLGERKEIQYFKKKSSGKKKSKKFDWGF